MSENTFVSRNITRRNLLGGLAAGAAGIAAAPVLAACGAPSTSSPPAAAATSLGQLPSAPVTLNILDVAGNLQLTGPIITAFKQKYPNIVAKVTTSTGTAPELAPKVQAQQQGGNVQIQLVLTGTDGLSDGITKGLWYDLSPYYGSFFPGLMSNYSPGAASMATLAQNQGIELVWYPSGPLLEYNPAKVAAPPATPDALLAWAKANPGKFQYAQPRNSGPGRTFLMGLPYVLGDKDPQDPIHGWDKTWAFLKQLNDCIPYYPGGTSAVMKELGEGTRDMTVTVTGWDINPRALGIVPAEFRVQAFDNMTWVNDAHFMVIPKGVPKEKLDVIYKLMNFMLEPAQQAMTYDDGYFYPGPAIKGVSVEQAPAHSQDVLTKYGRPEYAKLLAERPHVLPLNAAAMVAAFKKWDSDVGAQKTK